MTARLIVAASACVAAVTTHGGPPERFAFVATTPRGSYDCAKTAGAAGSETLEGEVTRVDAETLQVDLCPPTADCNAPRLAAVTVRAPGIRMDGLVARGTYVRVEMEHVRQGGACRERLLVASVDRWMGDVNRESRFFFAGHEALDSFADAPFRHGKGRCRDSFTLAAPSGAKLTLALGRTVEGQVATEHWSARLLRCDGDRASYWVAGRR
jgi:hypothetical protein